MEQALSIFKSRGITREQCQDEIYIHSLNHKIDRHEQHNIKRTKTVRAKIKRIPIMNWYH